MEEVWEDEDFEERVETRIIQEMRKEKLQINKFYKFIHVYIPPDNKRFIVTHFTLVVHDDISFVSLIIEEKLKNNPFAPRKVKEVVAGSAKKSKEDEFNIKKGIKLAVYRAIQNSEFLPPTEKKEIYSKFRYILTKFE